MTIEQYKKIRRELDTLQIQLQHLAVLLESMKNDHPDQTEGTDTC